MDGDGSPGDLRFIEDGSDSADEVLESSLMMELRRSMLVVPILRPTLECPFI